MMEKRMIRNARRGLTLVEVLVAVSLGVVVVGIVVSTSVQVQKAISLAQTRELAAAQVRGLFVDLEHDLARMIPTVSMPTQFSGDAPLQIERGTSSAPSDPAPVDRFADRLRLFTSIPHPDPNPLGASPAPDRTMMRSIIEYRMDTGGTGGAVDLKQVPGGWYSVGRLRRHILKSVIISDPAAKVYTESGPDYLKFGSNEYKGPLSMPVLVDNVVSFQVTWVDGASTDIGSSSSRSNDVFLDPDGDTATGARFLLEGNCTIAEQTATGSDAGATKLFGAIPIGGEVLMYIGLPDTDPNAKPTPFLVRQKVGGAIKLNDRPIIEPAGKTVKAKAFIPPAMIKATLIVSFGTGIESETARFSRVIPVTR